MKKKKIVCSVIILSVVLLLTGRIRFRQLELTNGVKGQQTEMTSVINDVTEKSHISKEIDDSLSVDADVEEGTGAYREYEVALTDIRADMAKMKLEEMTGKSSGNLESQGDDFWYTEPDGGEANYVDGCLYLLRKRGIDDDLSSLLSTWTEVHAEKIKKNDLPFMSLQEATDLVMEYASQFTSEKCEVLQVNSVEESVIENWYDEMTSNGDDAGEWTVNENKLKELGDAYLIKLGGCKDGIPVYSWINEQPVNTVMDMSVVQPFSVTSVVTKDDIRYFSMDYPFYTEGERNLDILSVENALNIGLKKLQSQILDGKTVIDKIYLEYILISDTEMWKPQFLRPYWVFEYKNTTNENGNMIETRNAIRINAETGEDAAYGK